MTTSRLRLRDNSIAELIVSAAALINQAIEEFCDVAELDGGCPEHRELLRMHTARVLAIAESRLGPLAAQPIDGLTAQRATEHSALSPKHSALPVLRTGQGAYVRDWPQSEPSPLSTEHSALSTVPSPHGADDVLFRYDWPRRTAAESEPRPSASGETDSEPRPSASGAAHEVCSAI